MGWTIHCEDQNGTIIKETFRKAVMDNGMVLPEKASTDRGKPYECKMMDGESKAQRRERMREHPDAEAPEDGLWAMLDIEHTRTIPYNAKAKLIERWHRTVKEQFSKQWETFTGGTTEEKPERLAEMIKGRRVPLLEQLVAAFPEFLETYSNTVHTGVDMDGTPNEVYAANLVKKRVISQEKLDSYCLRKVGPLRVHRNGVRYKGVNFGQYDLGHLQGQDVYLRIDDADLSKVSVWSEKQFLCLARANQRVPADADHKLLEAAMKEKARNSRILRGAQKARMAIHEDIPETMARLQLERAKERATSQPPTPPTCSTLVPFTTPLDKEFDRLRTAVENDKPENRAARGAGQQQAFLAELAMYDEEEEKKELERAKQQSVQAEMLRMFNDDHQQREAHREEEARPRLVYESPFKKRLAKVPSLLQLLNGSENNESAGAA